MKEQTYKTFSDNLKYYMALNNKTRNSLCKDLGFNYTTVREWCNGTSFPRYDKIQKLADYFNISKSSLIEKPKEKLLNTTLRNSLLLTDYINSLARDDLERELLNNCTLLNSEHQKIINEQVNYYIDKENEEENK